MELFTAFQIFFGLVVFVVFVAFGRTPRAQTTLLLGLLPLQYFFLPPRAMMLVNFVDVILLVVIARNFRRQPSVSSAVTLDAEKNMRRLLILLCIWLGSWVTLGIVGVDFKNTLISLVNFFSIFLIFYGLWLVGPEGRNPRFLARGLGIGIMICVAFVFIQLMFGVELGMYPNLNENVNQNGRMFEIRYPGPFRDAQAFGQFLSVSLLFVFYARDKFRFDGRTIIGILGFICLMLSGTRIALLGFIVGSIYVAYVTKRLKLSMLLPLVGLIILGSIAAVFIDLDNILIFQRLLEAEDSFAVRFAIWVKSFAIFKAYPVAGIGFENFSQVILDFDPTGFWGGAEGAVAFNHPESTYLKFLIETGVVGFSAFLWLIFNVFKQYNRVIHSLDAGVPGKMFFVAGGAAYLALLITFISVYTMNDPRIFFFFSFLTMIPFLVAPVISEREG